MKAAVWIAAGILAVHTAPARADLRSAVEWARLHSCARAQPGGLRGDRRLRAAADDVAAGLSLRGALAAAGVIASRSGLLRLSGALTDADVADALASGGCSGAIADPHFRRYGAVRRGRRLWIVLASADSPPRAAQQATYGRQTLQLVNRARSAGRRCGAERFPAAPPLRWSRALAAAADAHSRAMAADGKFAHRGHDGSTPGTRVLRAGYGAYRIVGENIAAGAMTPAQAVRGWLASPAHCENIMDPRFRDSGIAFSANAGSEGGIYWTEDFAARAASALQPRNSAMPAKNAAP